MQKFALVITVALLSACSKGKKNVSACEDWLDATACGDTDFSTLVSCDIYEDTTCDIADYFDCLSDNTTCDDATGVADMSGWTSCAAKATCD